MILKTCRYCKYIGSDCREADVWYLCNHPALGEEYELGRKLPSDFGVPDWCPLSVRRETAFILRKEQTHESIRFETPNITFRGRIANVKYQDNQWLVTVQIGHQEFMEGGGETINEAYLNVIKKWLVD